MVVDTSAILAILTQEDDAERYAQAIESVEHPLISAATVVETGMVLIGREGADARGDLQDLLTAGGFQIVPVTAEQADVALDAFQQFGKGRGVAARLNCGDCFAYALASATGKPLLFKGDDFSETDIPVAI